MHAIVVVADEESGIVNQVYYFVFLVVLIQIVHKHIPIVCHMFIVISNNNNVD